ncbi:MAG: antirestriction protein ArdA [Oscillospiraceae bacterium]|nr:antirestriction protein ArdA [Oscillospiraceae bacterium]
MTATTLLKVFITNLGKYNEGELIGEWVSLPVDESELEEVLERIGINEQYEEYFITDFETEIDGLNVDEYSNIEELNELAEQLENLDEYDLEKVGAIIEAYGADLQEAIEDIDNYTYYNGKTLEEVAYEIVEECYELPEIAQRYFDYEAFARDLGFDGYEETTNGVIYR